jgi:hypothetical protein
MEEKKSDKNRTEKEGTDISHDELEHNHNFQGVATYDDKPNINKIINLIRKSIYNVLFNYFDSPSDAVLIASLLDSRFKKMKGWLDNDKKKQLLY